MITSLAPLSSTRCIVRLYMLHYMIHLAQISAIRLSRPTVVPKTLFPTKLALDNLLAYDSRFPPMACPADPPPPILDFFRSYFLIQGCCSTSERGSRSSGLYFSNWGY